jgi:hypothetical protein
MTSRSTDAPVADVAIPALAVVTALVQALMKADGDVIVLDSGSAPYVTANGGAIPIETGLSALVDVEGLIAELLPAEQRASLERLGALSYDLPPLPSWSADPLTLVVVRLAASLWVEIGRTRTLRREEPPSVLTMEGGWYAGAPRRDGPSANQCHDVVPGDGGPSRDASERRPAIALPLGLDRLLQMSAARRASTLYLMSEVSPVIRVGGGMQFLDGEPPMSADELEALLVPSLTRAMRSMMRKGRRVEWISEVPGLGRVLCATIRDRRGVTVTLSLAANDWEQGVDTLVGRRE